MRLIYSGYCWSRAISLSFDEKYEKALYYLHKSERCRLVIDGEFLVLKGFLYGAIGGMDESKSILCEAIKIIWDDKYLNTDEKKYLSLYSKILIDLSNGGNGKLSDDTMDVVNVAEHYKKKFPL